MAGISPAITRPYWRPSICKGKDDRDAQTISQAETDHWTGVIERALPLVSKVEPPRPCHYGPWSAALMKMRGIDAGRPKLGRHYCKDGIGDLMSFAHRVVAADWSAGQKHLAEFALRFLEADVMLMASGYAKRHLLRRLRQTRVTDMAITFANEPDLARRLYGAGARLVLPAGFTGCLPLTPAQREAL